MLEINLNNIIYQLHYSKDEPGFLFGFYQLESISPLIQDEFLEALSPTIFISKYFELPTPWKHNPNVIGEFISPIGITSPYYYLPRYVTKLFHTRLDIFSHKHLLLFEHSSNDQFLDITIVHGAAVSGLWTLYTNAWKKGLLTERIDELKKQLIQLK